MTFSMGIPDLAYYESKCGQSAPYQHIVPLEREALKFSKFPVSAT